MVANKLTKDIALSFILGGNSTFTCLNVKTSNRFTFKVSKHKKDNIYFVKVLTGTDQYTYIGVIDKSSVYKHSSKSSIKPDSQSAKVFNYIYNMLKLNLLPDFIEIWHSGLCGKCGKKLTVPSSIKSGFGPDCFKRISKNLLSFA